jgi:uncharacterized membrane protein (DUF485 family)
MLANRRVRAGPRRSSVGRENPVLHEPAPAVGDDPAYPYKRRLGVWMFASYSFVYAVFVLANLVAPSMMEVRVLAGVNLATIFGLGLIVLAVLLALVYNALCLAHEKKTGGG